MYVNQNVLFGQWPTLVLLANNPDVVDKLEGLIAQWSKVIEQVLAESEQVGLFNPLSIFSPLFFIYFLWYYLGEFAYLYKSRHLIFDDHFLYSHDLYVWTSSDIVRRI